jgi:alpha-L-fucosidase
MPKSLSRRRLLQVLGSSCARPMFAGPLPPIGPIPSQRQLIWHAHELAAFLHFGINTFTDKEWGYGDEDPSLFDPTQFDADAIVAGLKAGGMTAFILTCKHHDGFCLWPTKTTDHCVRSSKWRSGQGDVVKDLSDAARRADLRFGVYLSPWDRNHAAYGKPKYIDVYRAQLRELLTQYGPIHEVWFDGANGGDGYYGGAREKRTIDKRTYYDWAKTWELVRSLQPHAVIFSDVGPDIRWVGNERGEAGETCWATYAPIAPDGGVAVPGLVREKESTTGTRYGSRAGVQWMPAECDVSIRPGWFWHESENSRVKTPRQLLELYYRSVGRGAGLLLNVPPDRRGLLDENDVASLKRFGTLLRDTFATNLADLAKKKKSDRTMELVLPRDVTFNVIRIRENIERGQQVDAFELDRANGGWDTFAKGTSIGARRLIRLGEPITAKRVRVRITQASDLPAISEVGLFLEAT